MIDATTGSAYVRSLRTELLVYIYIIHRLEEPIPTVGWQLCQWQVVDSCWQHRHCSADSTRQLKSCQHVVLLLLLLKLLLNSVCHCYFSSVAWKHIETQNSSLYERHWHRIEIRYISCLYYLQGGPKTGTLVLYLNFVKYWPISNLFHSQDQKNICINIVTKDPKIQREKEKILIRCIKNLATIKIVSILNMKLWFRKALINWN